MTTPVPVHVTADYTVQYADPITLRAGEAFTLTGKEDVWQGHLWLWGVAADGRAGWVPEARVEQRGAQGICRQDYDARELSVRAGETVTRLEAESGWCWCENARGERGWVPAEHLAAA